MCKAAPGADGRSPSVRGVDDGDGDDERGLFELDDSTTPAVEEGAAIRTAYVSRVSKPPAAAVKNLAPLPEFVTFACPCAVGDTWIHVRRA